MIRPEKLARAVFALDVRSDMHGEPHWRRVFERGREICGATPGADLDVVRWFAWLHDCARNNDGSDPQHGHRAARLVASAIDIGFSVPLQPGQLGKLLMAMSAHTDGRTSEDPTIGACWDADRLDLPRCGIIPDPTFMSTAAGVVAAQRIRQKVATRRRAERSAR